MEIVIEPITIFEHPWYWILLVSLFLAMIITIIVATLLRSVLGALLFFIPLILLSSLSWDVSNMDKEIKSIELEKAGFSNVQLTTQDKFTASLDKMYFQGILVETKDNHFSILEITEFKKG